MSVSGWIVEGADLYCPTAVSPAPGRVVVFARNAAGDLIRLDWKDGQRERTRSLGHSVARSADSEPPAPLDWQLSACCDRGDCLSLFGRSTEGDLVWRDGAAPPGTPFQLLGAPAAMRDGFVYPMGLAGPPASCSDGEKRADIFALNQAGELLHAAREGEEWSEFTPLGVPSMHIGGRQPQAVPVSSRVAACRCGREGIAVFLCTAAGALLFKWWDRRIWSDFVSLGMPEASDETYPAVTAAAPLTGPPAACSWGAGRLDVFARGPRGEMLHKTWKGRDWGPFGSLGIPAGTKEGRQRSIALTGSIAACSPGRGQLDVFATAVDGNLYHARVVDAEPSPSPGSGGP